MSDQALESKEVDFDQSSEHELHHTYNKLCSTCFKEDRVIKAHKVVNFPKIETLPKNWAKDLMNKIIYGNDTEWYEK